MRFLFRSLTVGLLMSSWSVAENAYAESGTRTNLAKRDWRLNRQRPLSTGEIVELSRLLNGLSAEEVVKKLGTPSSVHFRPGGTSVLTYRCGRANVFVQIQRNGKVAGVSDFQERQTGVSDDDFIGVVGP